MAYYLKSKDGQYLTTEQRCEVDANHPPLTTPSRKFAHAFEEKTYADYIRRRFLEKGFPLRLIKTYWFFGIKEKVVI